MKIATTAILLNVAFFTLGVVIQQCVLGEEVSKRIVNALFVTPYFDTILLAYLGLPIAILAACIYCILSYYRYERKPWKLIVAFCSPGMIACTLISLFNVFLSSALIT